MSSDTYTITATNTGNVPISPSFVVTDLIPANLQPDSRPATNVTFTDPRGLTAAKADVLAYHDPTTNTFVTVTATCSGTGTCTASIPTLADQIQITYTGSVPVGFAPTATLTLRVPASAVDRTGVPIVSGDLIANCATVSAAQLSSTPQSCTAQSVTAPLPTMSLTKARTSPSPVPPPSPVSWQLAFGAPTTSPAPILNPVVTDCLPPGLDLVDPANAGDPANGSPPASFTPAPAITRVPGGCGAGTVQVVWSWAGFTPALSIAPGTTGIFTLNTQIQPGTSPKTLTNTTSATADNNPTPVNASATVAVAAGASLESLKLVKGSLDPAFTKFPDIGHTTIGGSADYQLTVTNVGNVGINKVTVIDILPFVGDTAVLNASAQRDSDWSPILTGPVTAPPGVTVSYSTSHNPCRPELNFNPPGCVAGSFSTTPPSPISAVASLEFSFPGTLAPGQTLTLAWPMAAPPNAPVGTVAWNSFGFTGFRTDTGAQLTPAEPNKVGIEVNPYPLMLMKQVNGQAEETPPGLFVPVGQPVTYTYLVTNPGDLTVGSVNLTDNPTQTISCPSSTIPPHGTIACTAPAGPAMAGQHADTATVSGQPLINGNPAGPTTAPVSDTANYFGSAPALTLVKDVNGQHEPTAPGLFVPVGSPVTFTYLVTNTGNVTLNPVTLTDNQLGAVTCPETVLAPGDTETCTAAATAAAGPHQNTATATGQAVDNTGGPVGPPATATDTANYFGSDPAISVVKSVNGQHEPTAPGLFVPVGDPVTFTYLVTNTGNVTLNPVSLNDDVLGAITCPVASLAPTDSETCTAAGGSSTAGAHQNTATASGQGVDNAGTPVGPPVSAIDTANFFGSGPALSVVKSVNGQHEPTAPGLFVPVGDPVTFTYLVTNTGNVTLNPVTLSDNVLGAITCPDTSVPPGGSETCTADGGDAAAGGHQNIATATGQAVDSTGRPVGPPATATDTANYFGSAPAISVVKDVNGQHEPTAPGLFVPVGDPVTFTYVVTNTGDDTLDAVSLSDNVLGVITCPDSSLAPGGSETCTKSGGDATAGELQNIATVTGQPVDNTDAPVGTPLSATDTADLFGSAPAITLVKDVNGHNEPNLPGLSVPVGSTVTFTYLVTNTGDVTLNAVEVSDNVLGPITCPKTSLSPSQSQTCTATATAQPGAQTNMGTVTADPVDGSGRSIGAETSASDPATYTGMSASVPTTNSTTTAPTAAPTSAPRPGSGSTAPNGLGGIATDLGRLARGGGSGSWVVVAALILLAGATGYYGVRRRRRRGLQIYRSRSGR